MISMFFCPTWIVLMISQRVLYNLNYNLWLELQYLFFQEDFCSLLKYKNTTYLLNTKLKSLLDCLSFEGASWDAPSELIVTFILSMIIDSIFIPIHIIVCVLLIAPPRVIRNKSVTYHTTSPLHIKKGSNSSSCIIHSANSL